MSFPTTTTSEQVNLDSLLPTHIRLRRAHTFPPLEPRHSYHETIYSQRDPAGVASVARRWFTLIKEYATMIGVVVGIIGVIVAIVTVVIK